MIYLYGLSNKWNNAINLCPFTTKVELFLKITKIKYEKNSNLFNVKTSPTGNVPWISHNDNKYAESDNIIGYLKYKFKVDPDNNLSLEQKMEAKLLKHLVEDNLNWVIKYLRYYFDDSYYIIENEIVGMYKYLTTDKRAEIINNCKMNGIGNMDVNLIINDAKFSLVLLSKKLGSSKYFLNQEKSQLLILLYFHF